MTDAPISDDHVAALCRALDQHGVEYVVIGGVAARLHDTGHSTVDLDVCPSAAQANLERLSAALQALGARLRVEHDPHGVDFDPHPSLLAKLSSATLVTALGPLDLCFRPAGFPDGFAMLAVDAVSLRIGDVTVRVASLADVVASKRAAGRAKDIVALPALEQRLRDM